MASDRKAPERVWLFPPHDDRTTGVFSIHEARHAVVYVPAAAQDARIAELEAQVVTFASLHAVRWARDQGLPDGHLYASHYDILAKCGARMDDFVRVEEEP